MSSDEREIALKFYANIFLCVSSSLSIIGCSLILLTYALYKDIRTPSRHILVCISIADLVMSVANFIADFLYPAKDGPFKVLCIIQSFVSSTAISCSFMWTMMLAVFLFISLVKEKPRLATSLIHPWFHLLCWLFPLTVNVIALSLQKLGNNKDVAASGWCWIKVQNKYRKGPIIWMLIDGKGLELLTSVIILVLYIQIKWHLRKRINDFEKSKTWNVGGLSSQSIEVARVADRKLIFIPIMFVLLRVWGTIRFFLYVTKKGENNHNLQKTLLILQTFGDNLIGAVNCILFCFLTPKVWNHMKETFQQIKKRFCFSHKKTTQENSDTQPVNEKKELV